MQKQFAIFYSRFAKPLLKFLLRRYNLPLHEAEDIAQDVWAAAYRSYNTFQNKSRFFTWLCKIAIFKTADYYRKYVNTDSKIVSPSLDVLNSLVSTDLTPFEEASLIDLKHQIRKCLTLIPSEYKEILVMRYYKNMNYNQISTALGVSQRAVEGRLYRAKKPWPLPILTPNSFLDRFR